MKKYINIGKCRIYFWGKEAIGTKKGFKKDLLSMVIAVAGTFFVRGIFELFFNVPKWFMVFFSLIIYFILFVKFTIYFRRK